ncbi:MAG: hypothetical protein IKB02_00175 [Clostridia bacterium]|nr:hypothetical protein [Clostridia bacterium]
MKKLTSIFFLTALLLMLSLSISSGVFGSWIYFQPTEPVSHTKHGGAMGDFHYAPEEVLPDDEQDTELGTNHLSLVTLILNENDKGYGLNINKKPIVHTYLKNPGDVVYCDQHTTGGHLKFMLDDNDPVNKLYFAIEKVSDVEYIAYTFSLAALDAATIGQDSILAYKTILLKIDGIWDADRSYIGDAPIIAISNSDIGKSIDVTRWQQRHTS